MSKKARDLLPPDGPAPIKAEDVRPSDDDLDTEVETRKIGIRRVTALNFADKLTARARWRPAGNSRRFWRQIEADDPFKKRPARPTDAPLDVYPAQRIQRVEGSMPKPQPEVAKAYPGGPRSTEPPPPRPRKEQPRKRPAPQPVHTPDPRPAPAAPQLGEPEPPPAAPPTRTPEPERPRHLPPKPSSGRARTGRQRMPSKASGQGVYGKDGKTAAQIRAEKIAARQKEKDKDIHPLKRKPLDTYRETMQNLLFSQDAFERGEELPDMPEVSEDVHRPVKIKGEVKRRSKSHTEPTSKAPASPPPPVDRTPPKPRAPKVEPPVDRSPSKGKAGGLDDLFGGGGDRVRMGRRTKKADPPEES